MYSEEINNINELNINEYLNNTINISAKPKFSYEKKAPSKSKLSEPIVYGTNSHGIISCRRKS